MTKETQEMPRALKLALELDLAAENGVDPDCPVEAAAELRRQHAEIERLKARVRELELMKYLRDGLAAEIPRDDLLTLAQDAYDYLDDAEEIDQGKALSIARGMMQDMAKAIFQLVAQNRDLEAHEGDFYILYALEQAECRKLRTEVPVLRRSLTQQKLKDWKC